MVVCKCRDIREEDYPTEAELKERIMQTDFNCGQCQIRYMMQVDNSAQEQYNTYNNTP
jgi:hypothetical protein